MAIILHQLKAVARKLARFVAQFFWHFRRALLHKHIAQKQGDPPRICNPKWNQVERRDVRVVSMRRVNS
jgi:hypothetical protein